jgi:hypothetical protein
MTKKKQVPKNAQSELKYLQKISNIPQAKTTKRLKNSKNHESEAKRSFVGNVSNIIIITDSKKKKL